MLDTKCRVCGNALQNAQEPVLCTNCGNLHDPEEPSPEALLQDLLQNNADLDPALRESLALSLENHRSDGTELPQETVEPPEVVAPPRAAAPPGAVTPRKAAPPKRALSAIEQALAIAMPTKQTPAPVEEDNDQAGVVLPTEPPPADLPADPQDAFPDELADALPADPQDVLPTEPEGAAPMDVEEPVGLEDFDEEALDSAVPLPDPSQPTEESWLESVTDTPPAAAVEDADWPSPVPAAETAEPAGATSDEGWARSAGMVLGARAKVRSPIELRFRATMVECISGALGLLLVALLGTLHLTREWYAISEANRPIVVLVEILLFGGVAFIASKAVNRKDTLPEAQTLLLVLLSYLIPLAAVAAGFMLDRTPGSGMVAALAVLGAGAFLHRLTSRLLHPSLDPLVLVIGGVFSVAALLTATMVSRQATWTLGISALFLVSMGVVWRRLPRTGEGFLPFAFACGLIIVSALSIGVGGALAASGTFAECVAPLGLLVAPLGVTVMLAHPFLAARNTWLGRNPGRTFLVAVGLSVLAALISTGHAGSLLISLGICAWITTTYAIRLGRPALLAPALTLAAFAYLLLPAAGGGVTHKMVALVCQALGYPVGQLPWSYAAVGFLPFLACTATCGAWLQRRGWTDYARAIWYFLLPVAGLCTLAALATLTDARVPAVLLTAGGPIFAIVGFLVVRQSFMFCGLLAFLGGVSYAQYSFGQSLPRTLVVLAAAGWLGVATSVVLRSLGRTSRAVLVAGEALLDAVACLALAATVVSFVPFDRGVWTLADADLLAHGPLAALVLVVGLVYRRAEVLVVGSILLARATHGATVMLGHSWLSPWSAAAFAGAAVVPLLAGKMLPRFPLRREGLPENDCIQFALAGMVALQACILPTLMFTPGVDLSSWPVAGALAAVAATLTLAALWTDRPWPFWLAPLPLAGSFYLAVETARVVPLQHAQVAAIAAAGVVQAVLFRMLAAGRHSFRQTPEPAYSVHALTALMTCLCAAMVRLQDLAAPPRPWEAELLLGAGVLLLGGRAILSAGWPYPPRNVALALSTALAFILTVTSGFDLAGARPDFYAAGMLGAALVVRLGFRHALAGTFHMLLLAGFALTIRVPAVDDPWSLGIRLGTLGAVVVMARFLLNRGTTVRSLYMLAGMLALLWIGVGQERLGLSIHFLPNVVLAFAALALLLPRVPLLGIEAHGAFLFSSAMAGGSLLILGLHGGLLTGLLPISATFASSVEGQLAATYARSMEFKTAAAALGVVLFSLLLWARGPFRRMLDARRSRHEPAPTEAYTPH